MFFKSTKKLNVEESYTPVDSGKSSPGTQGSFFSLIKNQKTEKEIEFNNEFDDYILEKKLKDEINYFIDLLNNDMFINSIKSTTSFWIRYGNKIPLLKQLAIVINNIYSSSAFIERFFSLCGIISNSRTGNMTSKLFTTKSFLKANIEFLNELSGNNS